MKRYLLTGLLVLTSIFIHTPFAHAGADLALTGTVSFTGTTGVAMPITDLQITGTTPSTTPVKLFVTNGTLAMSTTTGLTFTGSSTGSILYFTGTLANINAALATLTYTRTGTGTDTLEASLVNYGEAFFPINGHLYKFITGTTTWNSAASAVTSQTAYGVPGYLATITSQSENDYISARISADGWIGASDAASEGDWKWVTGPETGTSFWSGNGSGHTVNSGYANWNTGEPNNAGGNENCAEYYSASGKWNDLNCGSTTLAGYMAEFGTPGNLPTVVSRNISITTTVPLAPVSASTGTATTTSLVVNWVSGGGSETNFLIEQSQSDCTGSFSQIASVSSSLTTYTATGLSPETQYCFRVRSTDGSVFSSYATTAYQFTLANTPVKPTVSGITTTSVQVAIPTDGNPWGSSLRSLYSIQEVNSGLFLQYPNGSLGGGEGFTGAPAWNANTLTGLTPNMPYAFKTHIAYRNTGGGFSAYSPTSDTVYTLASTPSALTTSVTQYSATLSWSGDGTSYLIMNDSTRHSTSLSATTYTFTGLGCNSDYTFRVQAFNHDGVATSFTSPVTVHTSDCSNTSGVTAPVRFNTLVKNGDIQGADTLKKQFPAAFPAVSVSSPATVFTFTKNLKFGMSSSDVIELQKKLSVLDTGPAAKKLQKATPSKYFGSLTKAAVIEFQKSKGIIPANGVVGVQTRTLLNEVK